MSQVPLFGEPAPAPPPIPGLVYCTAYIDSRTEVELIGAIDAHPWRNELRRRTQQYGLGYPAGTRRREPEVLGEIPTWLAPLAARLAEDGYLERAAENVVINEYLPGQGIGLHRDLPAFGDKVAAVSLGSAYVLDFVDPETNARAALDVAPRSLFVIGGEARSRWFHGIAPRKFDVVATGRRARGRRISITFRTAITPRVSV